MKFMDRPKHHLLRGFHTLLLLSALSVHGAPTPVAVLDEDAVGVSLRCADGNLRLEVYSPRVVRVTCGEGERLPQHASLAVNHPPVRTRWKLAKTEEEITLRTDAINVRVKRASGAIGFYDKTGQPLLLGKADGGRTLTRTNVGGLDTLRCEQVFQFPPDEAVFGLGQHLNGRMNQRGLKVHLQQENRVVAVPVLLSSRGYGVLWDNPAVTDVDAGAADPSLLSWNSEAGEVIDYYFMYGPDLNEVVAEYRELTGPAPLFPKWTWGFWQCRERYQTQKQILGVLAEYRGRQIPIDAVIQDWQYWVPGGWGSHEFDPQRFPDPAGMVKTVHDEDAHIIISVWPRFDLGTSNLAQLEAANAVYPPVYPNVYPKGEGKWYDPFNPEGRRLYWESLSDKLFSLGFDGWWMDASEAELGGKWGQMRELQTGAGPGPEVFNAYPLMHSTGVYQGQRAEASDKRVFILTRSGFTGQQRNAAVTWSGDTHGTWEVLRQQIPAGLNFVATGIPYWNTDIGGFFGGDPADPKYAELFTRWFQFGAFCPMFRVHGTGAPKEMWRFDDDTQKILIAYDHLRYHLLPYIYSVSWKVSDEGYTMMRPLVMDFRADSRVFDIPNQFLFGPSLMACPVTEGGAVKHEVYLPQGTGWTDFWTGKTYVGGQVIEADSPIETMPLFVRAGSILPYGPAIDYAVQSADPIDLRVYRGADGTFTLYEDENDNYNYEKGAFATIPMKWSEAKQRLTIGKRAGKFPGMLKERTFRIVFVSPNHGAGIPTLEKPDAIIRYTGRAVKVHAR